MKNINLTIKKFDNKYGEELVFDSKDHVDVFDSNISVMVYEDTKMRRCYLVVNGFKIADKISGLNHWYKTPKDVLSWFNTIKNKDLDKLTRINKQIADLTFERDVIQGFWRSVIK